MKDFKDEIKPLRGAFPKSLQTAKPTNKNVTDLKSFRTKRQFYAVTSNDEIARRFKLMTRQGMVYSISYSLLPVFILSENKELVIKTHDIQATIHGRNLAVLEDYLSEEQCIWIKESPSGKDDGSANVFIERMDIEIKSEEEL